MIVPGANPPEITSIVDSTKHEYTNYLNISHFGSLADDRSMTQVLNILPIFFKEFPEAKNKVRFHVYGTQLDQKSKEWLQNSPYHNNLIEHGRLELDPKTGLTGRQRIAIKMQESDVLLLLHGKTEWCREYIPSKIYDYFWTSRPIWAITNNNPQLDDLIQPRNGYLSDSSDQLSIYEALDRIWHDWKNHNLIQPKFMPVTVEAACKQIITNVSRIEKKL